MWQLHHLAQFRAVYEHGSVSAAARALGLTQPALSRSLQKLEESVGAALFQRHTRALRPTELAALVYRQAVRVLDEAAGLDSVIESFHDGLAGLVKVGCGPFVPDIVSQALAPHLQRQGTAIRLDIQTDHFEALLEGLYAYRHDFLVYDVRKLQELPDPADGVIQPLLRMPVRLVAPRQWLRGAGHRAAHDPDAALRMVLSRPWALPRVAPEYGAQAPFWFQRELLRRRGAEFQLGTISSCLALCRSGRAITIAPDILLTGDREAGAIEVLPLDMGVVVETAAYRLRSRPLSEAAGQVWRMMKAGVVAGNAGGGA
ncbi:LysR family transcriptional regulator [Alcanivorax sp. N3-2A]|nr:LysR family transcriptional regulator [Alcanivorax sp. N3-2A]|tara:strand:+ start:35173 stop:36117 length:945 start_codon:yes stop_codon:yes gene_type:complete